MMLGIHLTMSPLGAPVVTIFGAIEVDEHFHLIYTLDRPKLFGQELLELKIVPADDVDHELESTRADHDVHHLWNIAEGLRCNPRIAFDYHSQHRFDFNAEEVWLPHGNDLNRLALQHLLKSLSGSRFGEAYDGCKVRYGHAPVDLQLSQYGSVVFIEFHRSTSHFRLSHFRPRFERTGHFSENGPTAFLACRWNPPAATGK
jgi:hypothetical protein